jgi:hypothetical protein
MFKFQLQPYGGMQSRYRCPHCNHRSKSFVRYVDAGTGDQLAPHVGRCSREDKCGYHFKPGQYFKENGDPSGWIAAKKTYSTSAKKHYKPPVMSQAPVSQIHPELVNRSFCKYDDNNFVQYLVARFGLDVAHELVAGYRIGSSRHWHGATVFWQLDTAGIVRTGKIMLYDRQTGKRVKQPFNHITWVHSVLMHNAPAEAFNLSQCLFGEHLLAGDVHKPVAIVESEKTAIIASACMPAFIWLACGSLTGLNASKCGVLKGRKVMLFPDVNAYDKWLAKAAELSNSIPGVTFTVSAVLERMANQTDRQNGVDLGDVLLT